jgi:tetratricopeptide (TPR) repeat protein
MSTTVETTQAALARAAKMRNAGNFVEAEQICHTALTRDPDNADIFQVLGMLALESDDFGDAVVLFRRAVALAPKLLIGWLSLAKALIEKDALEDALQSIGQAIDLNSRSVLPYLMQGEVLARMSRHEPAIAAFRAGLEIQPDNAICLSGLAYAQKTIGLHDDAVHTYRELLRIHPQFADAYWSLANLKNVRFEVSEIAAMEEHAANDDLPDESRTRFCFALAKACEDRGDFGRAFDLYARGNSIRRMRERYDPQETHAMTDRLVEAYRQPRLDLATNIDHAAPVPIFIVGLPRSGSTLLEQILASHSQVEGTHELAELERLIGRINSRSSAGVRYPERVGQLTRDELLSLGREYLEATERYRTGAPFFVDKMPNNFRHVGLIRQILPQAKVIDARRHPLDSCLGSYKQLFVKGQPFSYDLFELGEYFLEYRRLMKHWRKLLPGYVLDVHYENVVMDPEGQMRKMLAHCGLDWESECLNFHTTERAINTASSEQVRQPIYTESLNNWRNYEAQLDDLIDILRPILSELPEEQRPAALA